MFIIGTSVIYKLRPVTTMLNVYVYDEYPANAHESVRFVYEYAYANAQGKNHLE